MMPSAGRGAARPRAVLDTNVLLSALLFPGITSRLVDLWQSGRMTCLVSRTILEEYLRALAYPKFNLTDKEVRALVEEEFLPFAETVSTASSRNVPFPKDPDDRKFLECAVAGTAGYLLTGDKALLAFKRVRRTQILTEAEFMNEPPQAELKTPLVPR